MQETDPKDKALTVAAVAFDIQQKTIRRLTQALIIALIISCLLAMFAAYALNIASRQEKIQAEIVGASFGAAVPVYFAKVHKARRPRQTATA